jgi:outer membrane protein assembly factor BamB
MDRRGRRGKWQFQRQESVIMTSRPKAPTVYCGIFVPLILVCALLNAVCCSGTKTAENQQSRKESDAVMSNSYVRKYADARRSSFIDVASSSAGKVVWQVSLHEDTAVAFAPEALLTADGYLVAYSRNLVNGFDAAGKRLWTKVKRPGSPVTIFDGKVYFRAQDAEVNELNAVKLDGAPENQPMYVLDAFAAAAPVYIEPLADGFLAMCVYRPMPEEGGPETTFYKKEYGTLDYGWVAGFPGEPPLLPIYESGGNRFVVFGPERIAVFNASPGEGVEEEEELARFKYPLEPVVAASADAEGRLYLLGRKGDQAALVVIDDSGKEQWRWTEGIVLNSSGDVQPPVLGPANLVHIGCGRSVMTLADGALVRKFETDGEMVSYVTALADGTLLVAAEKALYVVDGEGKTVFSLEFDQPIAVPPVAGTGGGIYVAVAKTLTRID